HPTVLDVRVQTSQNFRAPEKLMEKSHGSWGWIVIDCARVILFSGINKLYRKGRFHSWGFGLF
ncbi:hypothetical protein, partial [Faecalibaculum rodentium]|uniref:hypothetical protein n=1 Tax=Faecalibaculum rodentium TaxID=1702221 RepID=UPI0023F11C3C